MIQNGHVSKILFDSLISEKIRKEVAICSKETSKTRQICKSIGYTEVHFLYGYKTGFFYYRKGKSIEPALERMYLHVYREELFVLLFTFLQVDLDLQNCKIDQRQ